MLSRPLSCACGKERIAPPILCGTEPPKCKRRCNKILSCGHKCYFDCHFGPCPVCEEIVDKKCECGSTTIKQVKCSKAVRCQNLCDNELPCGHKCRLSCHPIGECELLRISRREKFSNDTSIPIAERRFFEENDLIEKTCFTKCNKVKEKCKHHCMTFCHPGVECPDLFCGAMVKITCACGNKTDFEECGKLTDNQRVILPCDDRCKNVARFKALYEAEEDQKQAYYSMFLVRYGKGHGQFLRKLQQLIKDMYFNAEERIVYPLDRGSEERLNFIIQLLTKHYNLEVSFVHAEKGIYIDIYKTEEFMIPKIQLSEYIDKINRGEIHPKSLPFDAIIKFFNLTVFDKVDHLEEQFKNQKEKFYAEKIGVAVFMYIWNSQDLDEFTSVLKALSNHWSTFSVESNLRQAKDKEKEKEEPVKVSRKNLRAGIVPDEPVQDKEGEEERKSSDEPEKAEFDWENAEVNFYPKEITLPSQKRKGKAAPQQNIFGKLN